MTRVGRGSRLALKVGDRTRPLRALTELDLSGDWALPVLALAPGLSDELGDVEIVTEAGPISFAARLVHDEEGLVLRPASGTDVVRVQRRQDVRGPVELPLRAAVLDPRGRPDLHDLAFEGATRTVSAGGLSLSPSDAGLAERLPVGARIFLELELPDGAFVPAVLSLVESGAVGLRGTFLDIANADRERLVRLVFLEQRRELAARRHVQRGPRG